MGRWLAGTMMVAAVGAGAQTCTTQAKLVPGVREQLSTVGLEIATAIKNGDSAAVQKLASTDLTQNFGATAYLVRTTGETIANDSLRVTHLYQLDANARAVGDTTNAEFSCPLTGSAAEVDFSISGLPKGLYAFVSVDAVGDRPWMLALLLRQEGNDWKLAGLYPHAAAAAGHEGLWYWTDARANVKAGKAWLGWLEYGLADSLLQPAAFVGTTTLDKLRTEQSTAMPAELRDGLSPEVPYVVKGADGATFAVTALSAVGSEDGKRLNLVLRFKVDAVGDPAAARARNLAAAKAVLAGRPELKAVFDSVFVSSEVAGQQPFTTQVPVKEL